MDLVNGQPAIRLGSQRPNGFHLGYRRWLDGLRGIAIVLVLLFHFHLLPGGSLGVDVFFVLSGFLITTLLAEEWERRGSISLKYFYLRRALRLLPAFLMLLVICGLTGLTGSPVEMRDGFREILVAGCYVANWPALHATSMPRLGHTWSLSVEEQFYLLWPILLSGMFACRLPRRRMLLVVCGGIVACAVWRIGLYELHRTAERGPAMMANIARMYVGLDTRADSLLVGCLVGLLAAWGLLPRYEPFVRWAGCASLGSAFGLAYLAVYRSLDHSQYYHGLFTVVALMVGLILIRLLLAPSRLGALLLEATPLVWVGRLSYGLYLYHIPILYWLKPAGLGWQHPGPTLWAAILTLAAALLSYICIERPCLRLKARWAGVPTGDPAEMGKESLPFRPAEMGKESVSWRAAA